MKRLKFLCTFFLVIFFCAMAHNFVSSFADGIQLGWNIGKYENEKGFNSQVYSNLHLAPNDNFQPSSVENFCDSSNVAIFPSTATCIIFSPKNESEVANPLWFSILDSLLALAILVVFVLILVTMVKIILSFRRSEVFEKRNISRINFIGRMFVLTALLSTILELLNAFLARQLLTLSHYTVTYAHAIDWEDFLLGLAILLMNEILIVATKMKEEHDLTI